MRALHGICLRLGLALSLSVAVPPAIHGQAVDSAHVITRNIGLPPAFRTAIEPSLVSGPKGHGGGVGIALYKDIVNPAVGLLGIQLDGQYDWLNHGQRDSNLGIGVRSPFLAFGFGWNINLSGNGSDPFISFAYPVWRGGFLRRATLVRASYVFGGPFRAGISVPLIQPQVGYDRPIHDQVRLATAKFEQPRGSPVPELQSWLVRAVDVIVPSLDSINTAANVLDPRLGWTAAGIIAGYHDELDRTAGSRAAGDSIRKALLDSLLIPYARLLGQKREPETLAPFRAPVFRALQSERSRWIAAQLMATMDAIVATQRQRWKTERLVWLPLQIALREEQHQTQMQIDSLIERANQLAFSDSNQVVYVPNEQFQWQLNRSIHDARTYHVLWVHDFMGRNLKGESDADGFRQTTFGYLSALLERVRNYDRDGILPDYEIILDEFYYEMFGSRIWMKLLNDPLHTAARLKKRPVAWQHTLDSLQVALREAVGRSQRLQAEARQHGGEKWLRKRVAVHVNITQQADPSFYTREVIPLIGLSDNVAHDHRKIAFYDITENDPYRGALIVAGVGVGEVYSTATWEDRAAIVRGNAAQAVKRAAARVLQTNGIRPDELPFWLKAPTDRLVDSVRVRPPRFNDNAVTAMNVHNDVGYGTKQVTITKAMAYSLMPAGSVIKIANPLILNPLWGSLLLGQALRGSHVLLMGPSMKNTPFKRPEMGLVEEMLARLLTVRNELAPVIKNAGGELRVGIYNTDVPTDNVSARIDTLLVTRARTPWLRELEPFSPTVIDSLRAVARSLRGTAPSDSVTQHEPPLMHIKEDFYASSEAFSNLFVQPGWGPALAAFLRSAAEGARTAARFAEFDTINVNTRLGEGASFLLQQQVKVKQSERAIYYILSGSQNADYRGALLDGESMLLISHFGAAAGIGDFILLPGLCTWVETPQELHKYLPAVSGFAKWFGRAMPILF